MQFFRSLRARFILSAGLCSAAALIAVVGYSAVQVQDLAGQSIERETAARAEHRAQQASEVVQQSMVQVQTLADTLAVANTGSDGIEMTREAAKGLLASALRQQADWLSIYSVWEMDGFDQLDIAYAEGPETDFTGRLIPRWTRGADGALRYDPVQNYLSSQPDHAGRPLGAFYLGVRESKQPTVLEPRLIETEADPVYVVSLIAPIVHDGAFRGIVGVDIPVAALQREINAMPLGISDGRFLLLSEDGCLLAGSGLAEWAGTPIEQLPREVAVNEQIVSARGEAVTAGGFVQLPIGIELPGSTWTGVLQVSAAEAAQQVSGLVMQQFVIGGLALGIGLLILVFTATRATRPLNEMAGRLRDIAEGEGDLTQRMEPSSFTELAELANGFNRFVERIHDMVVQVASAGRGVLDASGEITQRAGVVSQDMRRQSEQTTQIASMVEQINAQMGEAGEQTQAVNEQSRLAGEKATEGSEQIDQLVHVIHAIARSVDGTRGSISDLNERGDAIRNATEMISDIADQTNLLALNAAIEAARAGDAGRGFSVVADEVRKLAERTVSATEQVSGLLKEIQSQIGVATGLVGECSRHAEQGVTRAGEAGESLGAIVQNSRGVSAMIQRIVAASAQQAQSVESMAESTQQIKASATSSASESEATSATAQQVSREAQRLGELIARFKTREA